MASKLELKGFEELRRDLEAFPEHARTEAAPIVSTHAQRAQARLQATYPSVTGALRAGVKIVERTPRGVAVLQTVASTAPHAHFYEFGTVRTPPHAAFLPITEEERRASTVDVADMVEREGLVVKGARD